MEYTMINLTYLMQRLLQVLLNVTLLQDIQSIYVMNHRGSLLSLTIQPNSYSRYITRLLKLYLQKKSLRKTESAASQYPMFMIRVKTFLLIYPKEFFLPLSNLRRKLFSAHTFLQIKEDIAKTERDRSPGVIDIRINSSTFNVERSDVIYPLDQLRIKRVLRQNLSIDIIVIQCSSNFFL